MATSVELRPSERVGTAEREEVAALLADATAAGYLDADEFAERVSQAYAARTRAELEASAQDLPAGWLRERRRAETARRHAAGARLGMRSHVTAYVTFSLLMIGIWAAVGIGTGAWYPWPIWPILGWGVGVLGHVIPVRAALARR